MSTLSASCKSGALEARERSTWTMVLSPTRQRVIKTDIHRPATLPEAVRTAQVRGAWPGEVATSDLRGGIYQRGVVTARGQGWKCLNVLCTLNSHSFFWYAKRDLFYLKPPRAGESGFIMSWHIFLESKNVLRSSKDDFCCLRRFCTSNPSLYTCN